jgi:hypothetical protein
MNEPENDERESEPEPTDADPEPADADREPMPESVPDDWLDPKPFDPAGR